MGDNRHIGDLRTLGLVGGRDWNLRPRLAGENCVCSEPSELSETACAVAERASSPASSVSAVILVDRRIRRGSGGWHLAPLSTRWT